MQPGQVEEGERERERETIPERKYPVQCCVVITMMVEWWRRVLLLTVYLTACHCLESNQMLFSPPSQCRANQSYSSVSLSCRDCEDGAEGRAGLCQCQPGWRLTSWGPGGGVRCERCGEGQEVTEDGRGCIKCRAAGCGPCQAGEIRLERDLTGRALAAVQCVRCVPGTAPDSSASRCLPCHQLPLDPASGLNINTNCSCLTQAGLCLPANMELGDVYKEEPTQFQISYSDSPRDSRLLRQQLRAAIFLCAKYHNNSGCNSLANLCSLTLHSRFTTACSAIQNIASQTSNVNPRKIPRIFFPLGQTSSLLESESIQSSHSLAGRGSKFTSRLNITVAKYGLDGSLLSADLAKGNVFHLCNISNIKADAAWVFGTRYKETCKLKAEDLFSVATIFYDLFVPFTNKEGKTMVYSIPNRILNKEENQEEEEEKNWELTSRFFLVDSVGGVRSEHSRPDVIRYLESLELRLSLVNTRESPDKPGMIHPPLAVLQYREITKEEAKDGAEVVMKFSVTYKMDMKEAHKDVEISVGVLSVFAVLLSAVETWSWSRRSGKLAVDLSSLVMLLFTAAGYLSYVFLCVIFFSSLYWFIFFKQQTFVHVMLPTEEQEQFIKHYLISAFALKLINILFLLYSQITVDVFLLDWER